METGGHFVSLVFEDAVIFTDKCIEAVSHCILNNLEDNSLGSSRAFILATTLYFILIKLVIAVFPCHDPFLSCWEKVCGSNWCIQSSVYMHFRKTRLG